MLTYVARFASSLLTELDEQGRQHVWSKLILRAGKQTFTIRSHLY
jgi:hypothetical protein